MSVNKKALTYIFLNGRRERINSELNFPYEFFYGYNFLKNFYSDNNLIEFNYQNRSIILKILERLLNKMSDLPFFFQYITTLKNYKIIKNSDDIVMTNQRVAFSCLIMILMGKLRKEINVYIFVMGLLDKKVNYKIKEIFRRLFIKILFSTSKKLFFLSKGEYEFAKNNFQKYQDKFVFEPFCIDLDFWEPKKEFNSLNDKVNILFIGNDGSRDYEFIKSLVNESESINFNLISNNFNKDDFNKDVNLFNGSWVENKISDEEIKNFYHDADLTIIPLIDTLQPSGQSVALQSIACGTPVLITKTSGFWDPTKFKNKNNIIFFEKNETNLWLEEIETLHKNRLLMSTLMENGLKTIEENYSLQNFYENLKIHLE